MESHEIKQIASELGIEVVGPISFNEIGLDYQIAFAEDKEGFKWGFRLPRRTNLAQQIKYEAMALKLIKNHISVGIPDWKIVRDNFIAYPMLEDRPVISFDSQTGEIVWNIEKKNNHFTDSLANFLFELHKVPQAAAKNSGIIKVSINEERNNIYNEVQLVKSEIGIGPKTYQRWSKWLDDDSYWPSDVSLVHGDLYAGHILAQISGEITGVIDWSEIKIGDPSIDFSGHLSVFDENDLSSLIKKYESLGGRTWPRMLEHCIERHSISPLKYAIFALEQKSDNHLEAATSQLKLLE